MRTLFLIVSPLILGGCVSTAKTIVTAPFKVAGQAADWATTSQDEADRNRGRAIRKAEEKARKTCRRETDDDYAREQCVREKLRSEGW